MTEASPYGELMLLSGTAIEEVNERGCRCAEHEHRVQGEHYLQHLTQAVIAT